jgi:hypothetical protein
MGYYLTSIILLPLISKSCPGAGFPAWVSVKSTFPAAPSYSTVFIGAVEKLKFFYQALS